MSMKSSGLLKNMILKVIYDAAHIFGGKYDNYTVGTFGDASIFSFHAQKYLIR